MYGRRISSFAEIGRTGTISAAPWALNSTVALYAQEWFARAKNG